MNKCIRNSSIYIILLFLFALGLTRPAAPRAGTYAEDKKKAEAYAAELIRLRSKASAALAGLEGDITEKAFIERYGKIYGEIQKLRQKEGYIITFSAIKYRNQRNSATPFEARLISSFKSDKNFKKFWTVTMMGGRSYSRLIKPVFAEKSCLACHGPREKRPAFISARYPDDKSFAFKEGEIMGLISVYMPDEE